MPDAILDRDPQVSADIRAEKMGIQRIQNEKQQEQLAAGAKARAEAEQLSQKIGADLDKIHASLAETPLPGAIPGSQKEFTKRIAEAQVDAALTPESPSISQADQEHARLVDYVTSHSSSKEDPLADARPANVVPENKASAGGIAAINQTRSELIANAARMKTERAGLLNRLGWRKGHGYASLKESQMKSPPSLATKPGLDAPNFRIDRNQNGQMEVQRPAGSSLILESQDYAPNSPAAQQAEQAKIRQSVRERISNLFNRNRLPFGSRR